MAQSQEVTNYRLVGERELPVLPWKRLPAIRRYAAELVVPGEIEPRWLPLTRVGLQMLSNSRQNYEHHRVFEQNKSSMEAYKETLVEQHGFSLEDAEQLAFRELLMGNIHEKQDESQLTFFDKGE